MCFAQEGKLEILVDADSADDGQRHVEVQWAELRRIDDDEFVGYAYIDERGEWRAWW